MRALSLGAALGPRRAVLAGFFVLATAVAVGGVFAYRSARTRAGSKAVASSFASLRAITSACAMYAEEHLCFPGARSLTELPPLVVPTFIKAIPIADAWGHAIRFRSWTDREEDLAALPSYASWSAEERKWARVAGGPDGYAVWSCGSDGLCEHEDPRRYVSCPAHPPVCGPWDLRDDLAWVTGEPAHLPGQCGD